MFFHSWQKLLLYTKSDMADPFFYTDICQPLECPVTSIVSSTTRFPKENLVYTSNCYIPIKTTSTIYDFASKLSPTTYRIRPSN